jgi:glycosyltransferase involved in cell wall biosynthesis
MIVDHICVNYGAPLFQELFKELHEHKVQQNVFYPRNTKHRIVDSDFNYRLDSPLILNLFTKAFFPGKRRIMQKHYDPLFHRNKPDLIHAHTLYSDGSLANYYFERFNTPYLVAVRSTDLDVFLKFRPWLTRYGKKILENATFIVFISPSLKRKFQKIFGSIYESKSLIIPNGLNAEYLKADSLEKEAIHTPLKLLYVGSFLKRKNVPALIKYVENSDLSLTIVGGGGNEENKVLQMIQNSDKIEYLGKISDQNKLAEIYGQSDIFVMTSHAETFGLVYIEAMSQGLPVIYSKDTGIDGMYKQGTVGYGVSPGSINEMKLAIEKIISNYREISRTCLEEAKKLNWGKLAEEYSKIYARTLS